jgi:two-component system cell cycle sensor histidine kinase/response regulator CckA
MLGQPIELLLPERLRAGYRAHVTALGQAGTASRSMAVPGGFFALRADGEEFPVDASISQVRTTEGLLYTVLLRDVSERVKAAAQLKDVEAQLVQAQRMEAIGRLAGGVAHDFNNVLTVIIGVVQMLLRDREPDAPDRTDLEEVYQAALRAASLTRQLLAFSRRQALVPQPLDLNAVVEGVTHGMLRRLIGEDVQVVTALAADLGTVQADPGQLTQVVLNLAMNARDAMPNGGRLLVETANVELDSVYADTHLGVAPGPYAMLAVTDTGVGMDDATRLQAFEPFFTTKPAGQGTGLGLSTVYGIVKQSGGGVFVYSEPGRGATFKVYLPRIDRPAPAAAAGKPEATGGRTGTILLVEDESAVRAFAARVLRQEGYDVLETASRDEAVAAVRTRDVRIDLILTDVILAGGANGRDTADAVLALHPGAAVLFMSGYTNDAVLGRGGLDPGAYFLEKPFTIEALCRRVHEVLADHPSGGAGEQRQPA